MKTKRNSRAKAIGGSNQEISQNAAWREHAAIFIYFKALKI